MEHTTTTDTFFCITCKKYLNIFLISTTDMSHCLKCIKPIHS